MRLIWKIKFTADKRFIWETGGIPISRDNQTPGTGPESQKPASKEAPSEKEKTPLQDFLEQNKKLPEKDKEDFRNKAKQWDQNYNIEQLRTANVSKEQNEKDPLKRYRMLSSEYLKPTEDGKQLEVSFNSKTAEYGIGAGHMLPPYVEAIKVYNQHGEVVSERAVWGVGPEKGRIGYLDAKTGQYVPVFSGFKIEPIEFLDLKTPEGKAKYERRLMQAHMKTYVEPEQARKNRTPEENMAELSNRVSGNKAILENGKNLADSANSWAEMKDDDPKLKQFRTNDVNGGSLACAKVVSTILKAQGQLDRVELGVDATADALKKKGWVDVQPQGEKPQPGDVIVWAAVGGGVKQSPNGPIVSEGHKHIGIATGPNECISNSSAQKRPRKHSIYTGRPIVAILRARPANVTGDRNEKQQGAGQSTKQSAESATLPASVRIRRTKDFRLVAEDHRHNADSMKIKPEYSKQLENFRKKALANRSRYEKVERETGVPWKLIAALHNRESGMNFKTYLHNGDPLGKPTTHVPKGKLFYDWETAAIDAIMSQKTLTNRLGINSNTNDMGSMLTFAEAFNGFGYRNKGLPSSYVYAGTNIYQGGMYVADRKFDPKKFDKRAGVAAMLLSLS